MKLILIKNFIIKLIDNELINNYKNDILEFIFYKDNNLIINENNEDKFKDKDILFDIILSNINEYLNNEINNTINIMII